MSAQAEGMTSPHTPLRVLVAGLAVVVLWAGAFPAIRVAAPQLGVIGLSFVRLAIASAALLACTRVLGVRMPARRDIGPILVCAFFGMAAYQLLLNWGELEVSAGTASLIVAAAPLVSVGIAAVTLGERLSPAAMIGSAIALGGVAMVTLSSTGVSLSTSVWIIVAAMVVQGVYHPLSKPLLRRYSGMELATYTMVASTLMLLPLLPLAWNQLAAASTAAWRSAGLLGLLPSALGFVLWGYAVARLPVASATALLYLVPPVAVLIAFLWLGELPSWGELVGGAVVIAGVALISVSRIGSTKPVRAVTAA
jgi:drug/metabolite transporter (DMT)-like permease